MAGALNILRTTHQALGTMKVTDVRRRFVGGVNLALIAATAGCTLGEVTAAEGDDVLVVEAYLQAGQVRQSALLHRSLRGRVVRGETGAIVTVTTPDGRTVELVESVAETCGVSAPPEMADSLDVEVTCYSTSTPNGLLVEQGKEYELEVVSARGERLRGRTTVPGRFELRLPGFPGSASFPACSLPPRTNFPLFWSRSPGAWSYLAMIEVSGLGSAMAGTGIDAPDRLELTGLAISENDTTLVLPADFGLFELTNVETDLLIFLQGGFPAGVTVRLRLSALDRNYVNAIRGGSFNPSGAVRISSVVGDGLGVFGSYVPRDLFVVVEEESRLEPC